MKVGIQLLVSAPGNENPQAALSRAVYTASLAEDLGFDAVWVSEHHRSALNLSPDPLMLLGSIAAITEHVRLGTAIVNLPLYDPILLAERVALVDNLSNGRLELGIGRGFAAADYALVGLSQAQAWETFVTKHDSLVKAINDNTAPRCLQQPCPPTWLAASGSERSLAFAASHRYGLLMAGRPERLQTNASIYEDRWSSTHPDPPGPIGVSRAVHLADTRDQAIAEASEPLLWYRARMHDLQPDVDPPPLIEIIDTFCILGTPDDCLDAVLRLQAISSMSMLNCVFGLGGMDATLTERSIARFADEVLPDLRAKDRGTARRPASESAARRIVRSASDEYRHQPQQCRKRGGGQGRDGDCAPETVDLPRGR